MTNRANRALEYYNDYIDCTQNLPMDIQQHVTQMRECDLKYQEMMTKIKALTDNSDGSMSTLNSEKLTNLLVTGLNLGDKKVQTVQHMSDLVHDKVKRLENGRKYLISTKEYNAPKPSIKEKPESSNCFKDRYLPSTSTSTVPKELKKRNTDNDSNESNNDAKLAKRPRRNRVDEPDNKEISDGVVALSALQHTNTPLPRATATAQVQSQVTSKKSTQKTETKPKRKGKYKKQQKDNSPLLDDDDDDIAVNPDEPTYCVCDQISYGEMICCDNDLCPIEWFHFSCVTLSTKPKGKWFCPRCRGDRSNIMKPKAQFLKDLERYNKEKEDKA